MAASSKSMKSSKTSAKTSAARTKRSVKDLPSVKADRVRGGALKTRVGDPGE